MEKKVWFWWGTHTTRKSLRFQIFTQQDTIKFCSNCRKSSESRSKDECYLPLALLARLFIFVTESHCAVQSIHSLCSPGFCIPWLSGKVVCEVGIQTKVGREVKEYTRDSTFLDHNDTSTVFSLSLLIAIWQWAHTSPWSHRNAEWPETLDLTMLELAGDILHASFLAKIPSTAPVSPARP